MVLFVLRKYVWVVNVLLIVAIAYSVSATVNNGLRDKIESDKGGLTGEHLYKEKYGQVKIPYRSREYYDSILRTNLFGTGGYAGQIETGGFSEVFEGEITPKTSLNLELLGTFMLKSRTNSAANKSIAVIKNMENSKIKGYSEGQLVDLVTSEKVEVVEIDDCEVTIRRAEGPELITCGNELESVFAKSPASSSARNRPSVKSKKSSASGVSKVSEGLYQIERVMFEELLAEPSSLITEAKIVPRDDGIKIFGVKSRSVFYKMGLRNGDIVHQINEVALNDVQSALSLFTDLRGQSEFTVDFTRQGKRKSNRYTVY
ncbi:MAG: PDZ domain-containing protein [Candidatus Dadabacteria bacterium]|nr:PDZ domain-containing protein [Candidatus Dadabacteria bacterium]MDE0662918.1 PDZ domain-containing protein [Candidatus Dadabacteria bacterium]